MANRMTQFFQEVRTEMRKVSWPTRQEVVASTGVVVFVVVLFSLFIGAVDWFFAKGLERLLRWLGPLAGR